MSWSGSITNTPESGTNVDAAIEKARDSAKSGSVDEAIREARDAAIDAQLDCIKAIVDAVGEVRVVGFSFYGHLNADGSGNVGMSGTLNAPSTATP